MRILAILLCIISWSLSVSAQVTVDSVYVTADIKPIFPGCNDTLSTADLSTCSQRSLYGWIFPNLRYPKKARENNIVGTVVVSFVVNTDGTVSDTKILKTPAASLSEEVRRLIDQMKEEIKWSPAFKDDQAVRYRYVLPIKFKLGYTNNKELFLVFNAWGDIEVFRGMVKPDVQDKIPGKFIKTVQTLDFQKSKDIYNVIGKAHIINFKRNKLALPQELKGLKPIEINDMPLDGLKVKYISSADQMNLSTNHVSKSTNFFIHNYIGDILYKGKLSRSNGTIEKIDASKLPDGVLFISFVQKGEFATTLAVKE